jgi:hypothetical protein
MKAKSTPTVAQLWGWLGVRVSYVVNGTEQAKSQIGKASVKDGVVSCPPHCLSITQMTPLARMRVERTLGVAQVEASLVEQQHATSVARK